MISAEKTWEGLFLPGAWQGYCLKLLFIWAGGTVINTSAKQQAVWPICFLLGRRVKRKQWGGVLHTVGDWHYLPGWSMEAFLLLGYSPQVGRSCFYKHQAASELPLYAYSLLYLLPVWLFFCWFEWVNPIERIMLSGKWNCAHIILSYSSWPLKALFATSHICPFAHIQTALHFMPFITK